MCLVPTILYGTIMEYFPHGENYIRAAWNDEKIKSDNQPSRNNT